MTTLLKGLLIGGGSVAAVGAGAGVATGLILPKALKAKKALEKIAVQAGADPSNSWSDSKKLNLVVLGDSESRGIDYTVDFTKKATVGYGGFLASDLKKAGKLGSYRNFSKSGARTLEQIQLISESRAVKSALKDADVVTMTIGANDLLQYINLFGSAMGPDIKGEMPLGGINYLDPANSDLLTAVGGKNPSAALTQEEQFQNALDQIVSVSKMYQSEKDLSKVITVKGDPLEILDGIQSTFTLLVHQLHKQAPNAKIEILGHAFPFTQWPDELLNTKRDDLNGLSILEFYDLLLDKMKAGANKTISGSADYVKFTKIDSMPVYKDTSSSAADYAKTFDDYVIGDDDSEKAKSIYATASAAAATQNPSRIMSAFNNHYQKNAFPSSTNIHPSVFGYQLIGNSLFSAYAEKLGIKKADSLNHYTYAGDVGFTPLTIPNAEIGKFINQEAGLLGIIDKDAPAGINKTSDLITYFSNPFVKDATNFLNEISQGISNKLNQTQIKTSISATIDKLKGYADDATNAGPLFSALTAAETAFEKLPFAAIATAMKTIFGFAGTLTNGPTNKALNTLIGTLNQDPSKVDELKAAMLLKNLDFYFK